MRGLLVRWRPAEGPRGNVMERNGAARRTTVLVAITAVLALVASGCGFLVVNDAHPGKPGDPLIITIPAHGTQLTSVTSVPVVVDLPRVQPGSRRPPPPRPSPPPRGCSPARCRCG